MANAWALQDAKNRFSEVVEQALHGRPQVVTRHGEEAVVVVAVKDFRKLTTRRKTSLRAFFSRSPLYGETLDTRRSDDTGRDIAL